MDILCQQYVIRATEKCIVNVIYFQARSGLVGCISDMPRPPRKRRHSYRSRKERSEVSCCIKYLMFGFNVLFWVSSLLWLTLFICLMKLRSFLVCLAVTVRTKCALKCRITFASFFLSSSLFLFLSLCSLLCGVYLILCLLKNDYLRNVLLFVIVFYDRT